MERASAEQEAFNNNQKGTEQGNTGVQEGRAQRTAVAWQASSHLQICHAK